MRLREIESDIAIIQYLDQSDEPNSDQIKQDWIDKRMVESFKFGSADMMDTHDTATPLRLYEETGKIVDVGWFTDEKKGLTSKISKEMGLQYDPNDANQLTIHKAFEDRGFPPPDVGRIMGATQHILDTDETLTEMQRQEAQEFLDAADRRGFILSEDYAYQSQLYEAFPSPEPEINTTPDVSAPVFR